MSLFTLAFPGKSRARFSEFEVTDYTEATERGIAREFHSSVR